MAHRRETVTDHIDEIAAKILFKKATILEQKALVVMSSLKGEGTSYIVKNLAPAFSRAGKKTVILDLNYLDPDLGQEFGLKEPFTVQNDILPELGMEETTEKDVLIAGVARDGLNLAAFSEVDVVQALLDQVRAAADIVLIDVPSVERSYLGFLIAKAVGSVILTVRADTTKSRTIEHVLDELKRLDIKMSGFILNQEREYLPRFIRRLLK